ncbi:hypothetical protein RYX56_08425 [Alkalihalophilus lindianensis]|uniref:Helix-turn-helix domain-containing protein n=1 Tax=Alkalihalophilus lindianensis TaxID=1630542 RepID=A0ABU3X938_9BACI|nr:hypothetical protein [Alkalihalophilus lindianensis]MDV2684394.1 hypothetical protein [Alkalihalophilus lindianensis]
MQSGRIDQFTHLSSFSSTEEFNKAITVHFKQHFHLFTKGEVIALKRLIRYSVKHNGVCNARVAKMVEATHESEKGISRSTFERMLRKARQLKIIEVHHTVRKSGGFSHCVYVFLPPAVANETQLTEREEAEKPDPPSVEFHNSTPKAIKKHKAINQVQDHSHTSTAAPSIDDDLPPYIPERFKHVTSSFSHLAPKFTERLWYSALSAYKQTGQTDPIEDSLPLMIQAFKVTIAKYKTNQIETSIFQYFYGTFLAMLAAEDRKRAAERLGFPSWLMK